MSRVFVSRFLPAGSPLRQALEGRGHELVAFSLLTFRPLSFHWPQPADWLFFYSRNGVRFFVRDHQPLPVQRLAALGPGTAAALRDAGLRVDFAGTGRPKEVAEAFVRQAAGSRVVFVQAARSRQSVQRLLGDRVEARSLVVYDNQPRTDWDDPQADILIFTSPLNARTYLDRCAIREGQSLVAWGESTADFLHQRTTSAVHLPEYPSEEAVLRLLLQQVLPLHKTNL